MGDSKGFLKFAREEPVRRDVAERRQDWNEFYHPMTDEQLTQQAGRCMDCGVPFCQSGTGCPVENSIPGWNDLVHRGLWKEAIRSLHATNNFPEFTGKLCPAPCESACVLGIQNDPVTIRVLESSIIETAFERGWVIPLLPHRRTGRRIAIIGSGPAGLSAAQELCREGHEVTVFEKQSQVGGLLRYGIPDFKLEKWMIDRRLEQLEKEGVLFKTSVTVGRDIGLSELVENYDALCLTIGSEQGRDLSGSGSRVKRDLPCDGLPHSAKSGAEFPGLTNTSGNECQGETSHRHRRRSDTGSDCIGTAHRQGCKEVHQFEILSQPPDHRSSNTPWPLWPLKLRSSHAHEEGCLREWNLATTEFLGQNGRVVQLRAQRVILENAHLHVSGPPVDFEADLVILAMGFTGPEKDFLNPLSISYDRSGNISTDFNFMTSVPGIFSAGDARRGASLIVWAIAEGRKMAKAVNRWVLTKQN